MSFGICDITLAPLRAEASDRSEMVSQLLYGEDFKILKRRKKWSYIKVRHDGYKAWIDCKQYREVSEAVMTKLEALPYWGLDKIIDFVSCTDGSLIPITCGALAGRSIILGHHFSGNIPQFPIPKSDFVNRAFSYLNAPYLWGGRSPFGIDCSGFVQLVYRFGGYALARDASQQAMQGQPLSFIEEAEAGDLAFFDNEQGDITHVGMMMGENDIIHASGKVRIDKIDHNGIYNLETQSYSHRLRLIMKMIGK